MILIVVIIAITLPHYMRHRKRHKVIAFPKRHGRELRQCLARLRRDCPGRSEAWYWREAQRRVR